MTKLRISPDVTMSLEDFVTVTQAILAKKGKGKSYTASVQAEELLDADQQIVALDPTGAWFGMRSSADGKGQGFPIVVIGGEHGDIPLETPEMNVRGAVVQPPPAAETLATAIATEHFSAIIDLSTLRKGAANRFVGAFLETLYRNNREALHLFVDEADLFAPQKPFGDEARTLGAMEDIVRRGRIRGIGCTLITQRPQVLNKNVLSQVDMLTTLGMNHPKDIAAIKEWVAVHGDERKAEQMIESLPSLPIGQAWLWAPASDLFKRVTIRRRKTFDSGSTPKAGERTHSPKVLAPVDIERLGKTIAATVEEAKANDPKALKAELARLKAANEALSAGAERAIKAGLGKGAKVKTVERPVIKAADLQRAERIIAAGDKLVTRWDDASANAHEALTEIKNKAAAWFDALKRELTTLRTAVASVSSAPRSASERFQAGEGVPLEDFVKQGSFPRLNGSPQTGRSTRARGPVAARPRDSVNGAGYERRVSGVAAGEMALTGPQRELLAAMAWWQSMGHDAPTRAQLAGKAGWKVKGSHLRNRLSELHTAGLITYPRAGTISLTAEGIEVAPQPDVNTTLIDSIRASLTGPQIEVFDALLKLGAASREGLAEHLHWDSKGSHLRNRLSELSSMELVEYPARGFVGLQGWVS